MRVFAVAVPFSLALSLFALSCGSDSKGTPASTAIPRADICNQGSQVACAKVFSCPDSDQILGVVKAVLGGSEAACRTTVQTQYCEAFQCTSAAAYNGVKAGECKTGFANVSCQTLSASAGAALTQGVAAIINSIPGCNQICSGSGSDAAAGQ